MRTANPVINQRIADRLLHERRISLDAHALVLGYCGVHGGRVEDALVENEVLSEPDLLRLVSTMHNTKFISTEKLYRAQIDARIIGLVPRKLADLYGLMPVMFDERSRALNVVTADPDNLQALAEVKVATGVRDVVPLYARPAAVLAAIQRAYHGDASLFAQLLRPERVSLAVDPNRAAAAAARPAPAAAVAVPSAPSGQAVAPAASSGFAIHHDPPEITRDAAYESSGAGPGLLELRQSYPPSAISLPPPAPTIPKAPAAPNLVGKPRASMSPRAAPAEAPPVTLTTDYVETLNVLVSLLENSRTDLRGHSALCARLVKKVCDRMNLPPVQAAAIVVGAYLHDLGKAGTYHLTPLNVSEYDGHRVAGQKSFTAPERFLQTVSLHPETRSTVNAMYERFDGRGFPSGLGGKEIPLGARILAVVDSYADLTSNPRNPARKLLAPAEAIDFLARYQSTVFDPTVLALLRAEVAGEDLRSKLLADRRNVLILDPDPEDATLLELRLLEAGFDVRVARTMQQAMFEVRSREVAVIICEVDLDSPRAALEVKTSAANEPWGKSVLAWVVLTKNQERELAEKIFELGFDDLVTKPSPPDVFVAKLKQLIERKAARAPAPATATRGVSGSLAEMGLPEVVQILWHGRKSCTVRLKLARGSGEIGFLDGQIVDATYDGSNGEEAFYKMLGVTSGDFQIDPTTRPSRQTIDAPPEGLLLEGMRRLDEGLV
jgi:response regulator RpfG family c-di-GMP phosphodiesterase